MCKALVWFPPPQKQEPLESPPPNRLVHYLLLQSYSNVLTQAEWAGSHIGGPGSSVQTGTMGRQILQRPVPSELLPPAKPHLLKSPPPKTAPQAEDWPLKKEPMGNNSDSNQKRGLVSRSKVLTLLCLLWYPTSIKGASYCRVRADVWMPTVFSIDIRRLRTSLLPDGE